MFMTILNTPGKPSEGFSLFSAGNVLWLIKAQNNIQIKCSGRSFNNGSIRSQPALSTAAEGKSANNCSPY